MRRLALTVMAAWLIAASCTSGTTGASPTPSSSPTTPPSSASPSSSPIVTPDCVDQVFDDMTERQRIGQLFIVGLEEDRLGPAEIDGIKADHFGSVSFIVTTTAGQAAVRAVADSVQALATQKFTAGVSFFVAANQEGGQIQALRGPGFSTIPTAVEQGQLGTSTLQKDARQWGNELLAAGVNLNFAPVMDVVLAGSEDTNQPIGVLQRNFGNDPETVGSHGDAFIRGMKGAGVATSAKHFPGLGRVVGNTDFTADVVDEVTTPDDAYLQTFGQAIDAGVPFVMVALATYTKIDADHLAVFSPVVMNLIREQFHFDGVIVSDDIGNAEAIASIPPGDRAIDFLQAGGDMIISKTVPPAMAMWSAIDAKVSGDPAFRDRIDESVRRVLQAKEAFGLLPCGS